MTAQTISLIVFAALLLCWAVGAYNRLLRLKSVIASAFGQIELQLKQRYDLITPLVEAAKQYLRQENETLAGLMQARDLADSASLAVRLRPSHGEAVAALSAAEQALDSQLGQFFAVSVSYPSLKGDATVREISAALGSIESQVAFLRQTYNQAVLSYNSARGQFPTVLVARLFFLPPALLLRVTESAAERQTLRVGL